MTTEATITIMRPGHPHWRQFQTRLALAVVTHYDPDAVEVEFRCDGDYAATRLILATMGFSAGDIAATVSYWAMEGGGCDCAFLQNDEIDGQAYRF